MQITAALVKELRERTGAGMMECKKALVDNGGDIEAAIEAMRKSGAAKADKKAGRIAAEGVVGLAIDPARKRAALVEVNCETDFVSKGDEFQAFAQAVAERALATGATEAAALSAVPMEDGAAKTVEDRRQELVGKIGENLAVRRVALSDSASGHLGGYLHLGGRIGVLVELEGGDEGTAKDIAMHVAASRPMCVSADQVPAEVLEKERQIFAAQAAESGKPPEIVDKMVNGRVQKYLREITLLGQPFVKDPDSTVEKYLKQAGAQVRGFVRFEVGEGIEKKSENFAEEVMAQVRGS